MTTTRAAPRDTNRGTLIGDDWFRWFCENLWSLRKKGRVLPARGAGACKDDHVMGDEPDVDQLFDAAGAQRGPGHPPEGAAVVAEEPDADQQLEDDDDC